MRRLSVTEKIWPVAGHFTISRSSLTEIPTIWVEISENGYAGRGECRPYPRYGDSVESVINDIESHRDLIENGASKEDINRAMLPGPARNAVDCALWDLDAKITGRPVIEALGFPPLEPRQTAYTLSIDTPEKMAEAARSAHNYPVLKAKVMRETALPCLEAIISKRPDAKLIIDANESLTLDDLKQLIERLPHDSIAMFEQPLSDEALKAGTVLPTSVIICADESLHSSSEINDTDLERLWSQGYRAINIKLDKCGGLTAAYALTRRAKALGFHIMMGCMVGSSLAMAPVFHLESLADILDLDGPLLLAKDCEKGLKYEGATLYPPLPNLWG